MDAAPIFRAAVEEAAWQGAVPSGAARCSSGQEEGATPVAGCAVDVAGEKSVARLAGGAASDDRLLGAATWDTGWCMQLGMPVVLLRGAAKGFAAPGRSPV